MGAEAHSTVTIKICRPDSLHILPERKKEKNDGELVQITAEDLRASARLVTNMLFLSFHHTCCTRRSSHIRASYPCSHVYFYIAGNRTTFNPRRK